MRLSCHYSTPRKRTRIIVFLMSRRSLYEQFDDLFPEVEIDMRCLIEETDVKIDRPFLYSIVRISQDQESASGDAVLLFTGIVTVPTYQ